MQHIFPFFYISSCFFFLFFFLIVNDFQQYLKNYVKYILVTLIFTSIPSTETLYRVPVLPMPVLSSRLPVSSPAVPRDRPTLPMGSRKALDGQTDGWTDEQIPRVLQDFLPFRAAAQKRGK